MARPARVIIDLNAARANLARAKAVAPRSKVMAVIKADAYGHGLAPLAGAFDAAAALGIACLEEAVALRYAGVTKRLVLLEGIFTASEISAVRDYDLDVVVHSPQQVAWLLEQRGLPIRVWLKVDSGMHRLGFDPLAGVQAWQQLHACAHIAKPMIWMTHLANAQQRGDATVSQQLQVFTQTIGAHRAERSIANSAALLSDPAAHAEWVRPGLMLYGVSPFADATAADEQLQPVMTLRSELIAVKTVKRGESVGYGGAWTCPEDMPVGVVAMGYGDGYPRHAKAGTPMLVDGIRCALIGRPSMDMLCVDLRHHPGAAAGAPVILWGRDGEKFLPVEEVARHADTVAYQLLCSMRMRVRYDVIGGIR